MKKKLFGTDGIRGKANHYPMIPEIVMQLGRAVVWSLKQNSRQARIVIGKDTRISGDMIVSAMASGICSMNGNAYLAGVIPTPGIAFLTVSGQFDAGVMISASHNPYGDNGIKLFDSKGFKLSDALEASIENLVGENHFLLNETCSESIGRIYWMESPEDSYVRFLKNILPVGASLKGLHVILDCCNGATYKIAPKVFSELGADVDVIFAAPNGKNINDHCGSQYTARLQQEVIAKKADMGFAFDGDGDRLIAVDEQGIPITGDQILAICARYLKQKGKLANNVVVSTVMSNVGLKIALKEMDIQHIMADVGDRYVLDQMQKHGSVLGGEDSGHMIFLNHHTSGDGIVTALHLASILLETRQRLSQLSGIMKIYPQILMNLEVKEKPDLNSISEIACVIQDIESKLNGQGRVLVRYSGTQPLCRVMVEGPDSETIQRYCTEIIRVIDQKLNMKL